MLAIADVLACLKQNWCYDICYKWIELLCVGPSLFGWFVFLLCRSQTQVLYSSTNWSFKIFEMLITILQCLRYSVVLTTSINICCSLSNYFVKPNNKVRYHYLLGLPGDRFGLFDSLLFVNATWRRGLELV